MPPMTSEALPGAVKSTLDAGKMPGWWRLTTAGRGPRGCPGGVAPRWLVTVCLETLLGMVHDKPKVCLLSPWVSYPGAILPERGKTFLHWSKLNKSKTI